MKLIIGNQALVLHDPGASDMKKVCKRFRNLFGVAPVVTIMGYFPADINRLGCALNLTENFYPVSKMTERWVSIKLPWHPEPVGVIPRGGMAVTAQFTLPI